MIINILEEIAILSGKKDKRSKLSEHKDNQLLKDVIYAAHSPRINYHIKQIPTYSRDESQNNDLPFLLSELNHLSNRDITGDDAKRFLSDLLSSTNEDNAKVLELIIGRNLKIGMSKGYNDVFPKLIETTPYMGAISFSQKKVNNLFKTDTVYSQIKADGTYRNCTIQDGIVQLTSRQGEVDYLTDAPYLSELSKLPDGVLNGELIISGFRREEANGMIKSINDIYDKMITRSEEETKEYIQNFEEKHGSFQHAINNIKYVVWDSVTLDEYIDEVSERPYSDRLFFISTILVDFEYIELIESKIVSTPSEAMEHFLDAQRRGLEGTIVKASSKGWKNGKPTYQIKYKNEISLDLKIKGFLYGNKGTKNEHVISRLIVESECGLLKTQPSGMKEDMMKYITNNQDNLLNTIVEVRCCGISHDSDGNHSLMHPSVVELRSDKDTCDTLETAKKIEEMTKQLKNK